MRRYIAFRRGRPLVLCAFRASRAPFLGRLVRRRRLFAILFDCWHRVGIVWFFYILCSVIVTFLLQDLLCKLVRTIPGFIVALLLQ